MPESETHIYRKRIRADGLTSFHVAVKETDLWVSAERDLKGETMDLVLDCRYQLESYIQSHREFLTTLQPYSEDPYAPPIIRDMIARTRIVGVGPMASVAGAVAQYVASGLFDFSEQVIVENGGDIFMKAGRSMTVSIFAGKSPLSERIGLIVPERQMPLGICSSSGSLGHSLSMGSADAVCILSPSAVLADGAATGLGNRLKSKKDLQGVGEWAAGIEGIIGVVAIMGNSMATWGDLELTEL